MTRTEWQKKFKTLKLEQYNEVKARLIKGGMMPRFAAVKAHNEVYEQEGK